MSLKMGTVSGTLFCVVLTVNLNNLVDTAVLAAVGATVSFCVSYLWKWVFRRRSKADQYDK